MALFHRAQPSLLEKTQGTSIYLAKKGSGKYSLVKKTGEVYKRSQSWTKTTSLPSNSTRRMRQPDAICGPVATSGLASACELGVAREWGATGRPQVEV